MFVQLYLAHIGRTIHSIRSLSAAEPSVVSVVKVARSSCVRGTKASMGCVEFGTFYA